MTQIELGRKTASLEVVEQIATALDVSYTRLFEKENKNDDEQVDKSKHAWKPLMIFKTI